MDSDQFPDGKGSAARGDRSKEAMVPLTVYNFNVHRLEDQWLGWVSYIRDTPLPAPDLVLLQDIPDTAGRRRFENTMAEAFGGRWRGAGSHSEWQTSIIWNARRFTQAKDRSWKGFGFPDCTDDAQPSPAVQVALWDSHKERWLSAISMKTSTQVDEECVAKNMLKAHHKFREPGWTTFLHLVGMDANSADLAPDGDARRWHRSAVLYPGSRRSRGHLGFIDAIFELYGGDPKKARAHATLRTERIDFLLVRLASGRRPQVVESATLPRGGRGPEKRWSDHRSQMLALTY